VPLVGHHAQPKKLPEAGSELLRERLLCAVVLVANWFRLRAEDRGQAAVALHALRARAVRIVASRCHCSLVVAEDHVADAVFIMVYSIRREPTLRIPETTTLAYLCGVARNEWRWSRWRRARAAQVSIREQKEYDPRRRATCRS
jgi:hypothetical protein